MADWIELKAVLSEDGNASIQDLVQAIRRSGTVEAVGESGEQDALEWPEDASVDADNSDADAPDEQEDFDDEVDRGSEMSEQVAQDAWAEIANRPTWCREPNYPFQVETDFISLKPGWMRYPYTFLLLLSHTGVRTKGEERLRTADAPKILEFLSMEAATSYFGGRDQGVEALEIGFPRRVTPKGFEDAVNTMCARMREGQGCRRRPTLAQAKDATLDIVTWRGFADERVSKAIAFGQCSAGRNWEDKLSDLQPRNFCDLWLLEAPSHDPIRMFFMPHVIPDAIWDDKAKVGGIMFDRYRLALTTSGVDDELRKTCEEWVGRVLDQEVPLAA